LILSDSGIETWHPEQEDVVSFLSLVTFIERLDIEATRKEAGLKP